MKKQNVFDIRQFFDHERHFLFKKFLNSRLFLFFIILAISLAFLYSIYLRNLFYYFLAYTSFFLERYKLLGVFIFILLAVISTIFSFFSSIPIVPFAVAAWGKPLTLMYLLFGWIIGEIITYWIGRRALYTALNNFISIRDIEYYRKSLIRRINFSIVFLFRLAMPIEVPGYLLGAIRYPFLKYIIATFFALLPFASLIVYASDAFLVQNIFKLIALIFIGFLAMLVFFIILHSRLYRKR
jgi:uncharacterized membrane protein YdjX (TVP38/TMEM64 family)